MESYMFQNQWEQLILMMETASCTEEKEDAMKQKNYHNFPLNETGL